MKIVVVGGSGLIGSKLVTILTRDGHEVVAASRRSGVDSVTGEGLAEALSGAAVVVDVSNSPSFEDTAVMKFFKSSTHNLVTAEAAAGVKHHVALSVVGTGRLLQSGYLRAKVAQEKLIEESTIPYSIVRATQFFEGVQEHDQGDRSAEPHSERSRCIASELILTAVGGEADLSCGPGLAGKTVNQYQSLMVNLGLSSARSGVSSRATGTPERSAPAPRKSP